MTRLALPASLAIALLALGCASPRTSGPPRTAAAAGGTMAAGGESRPTIGQGDVEDAFALWSKLRGNAEKALAAGAADPNHGWLDRAIESDGRALITALGAPGFDAFAATRDEIRARVAFVIKPPAPDDRREAVKAVDEGFAALRKGRRG